MKFTCCVAAAGLCLSSTTYSQASPDETSSSRVGDSRILTPDAATNRAVKSDPIIAESGLPVSNRGVQIRSVDFEDGLLELFNFNEGDVDLTGWRFCSHDFDQVRRYTGASGFDGVTIEAGTSLFVHFNDDAPGGDPDRVNRSSLGGSFATPLDQDAYGVQIYFPGPGGSVSFGNSTLIADHVQWNIDGEGVGVAEFRTQQAVDENLWSAIGDFVATLEDSARIELTDLSGDEFGEPAEYEVVSGGSCDGDVDGSGVVDFDEAGIATSI